MKNKLLFCIFLSVIVSANETKLAEENNKMSVYLDEKVTPQLSKGLEALNKIDNSFSNDMMNYKKVSLMDVVLETVSNSDLLKAAREAVVQSEIKLRDEMAGYYPTLNFESENKRTRMTDDPLVRSNKYYDDRNYKFILTQNLYSGGDTKNSIKSAKKKLDLARNKYEIVLQEEVTKAIKAYFDVVFAYRTVIATENNMKNLNKILEIVTVKYDNGAASIGDLTAIKANVSNAQTQLTKVRAKLTAAQRYYEYMVGENYIQTLPYEKNFNINVSTFDLLYERGVKNNSTIIGYNQSIESEKYNLKSKESAFAPKLDFEAAMDNVMDSETYKGRTTETYGMFRVTFNLYNGGKDKNKILSSYSAIRELNFQLDEEKKKLKWNISKLFTSIQSTNESLKSNISEVISLRKMVDAYWEEFNLGQQDLQSLLQGHKQLNAAETELINYENNNITDFFTLLGYTGDLLAFFDIDPARPKFIDFSKSNYTQNVYIDDKFLNEKEKQEKEDERKAAEELKNSMANKAIKDQNIADFTSKFLSSSDDLYTIEIGTFNNQKDATEFIKDKELDKYAFAYDTVDNVNIVAKVAYGIFPTMEAAKLEADSLSKNNNRNTVVVKKVKDIKKSYNDYSDGLKVKLPDPEVKILEKTNIVEKTKQEKKIPEFKFSETTKTNFLKANGEYYTIYITSFNDKKDLEKILTQNTNLYDNSFVYNYSNGTSLIRWDYGIYPTYDEAQKAIETLGDITDSYYPVVQKISKEQELYNANIAPETKVEQKEPEFEYVNVTSKTEYKDPVILKNTDIKNDKVLENKVKNLVTQKADPKPIKEKDEEVAKLIKKVETKPVEEKKATQKADPKPIKEKDEEVAKPIKKVETKPAEEKKVTQKADPKPIKEKDEEEIKIVPKTIIQKADPKPIKEKD